MTVLLIWECINAMNWMSMSDEEMCIGGPPLVNLVAHKIWLE